LTAAAPIARRRSARALDVRPDFARPQILPTLRRNAGWQADVLRADMTADRAVAEMEALIRR
jgi:hypothetical protein